MWVMTSLERLRRHGASRRDPRTAREINPTGARIHRSQRQRRNGLRSEVTQTINPHIVGAIAVVETALVPGLGLNHALRSASCAAVGLGSSVMRPPRSEEHTSELQS